MKTDEKENVAEETSEEEASDKEATQSEGVKVPEEFQQDVHNLVSGCDNHEQLDYLRSCISKKDTEIRESKMKKNSKGGIKGPSEYTTADMPSD